jgi:hypothetical protein
MIAAFSAPTPVNHITQSNADHVTPLRNARKMAKSHVKEVQV